ncbi:MAG: hypothetical protein AAFR53_03900 [Pseudomonadota bacterium]
MINVFQSRYSIALAAACLCWAVFGAPAQAQTPAAADWIEAADACERLVADQDETGFQDYRKEKQQTLLGLLEEWVFSRPNTSLYADASFQGERWTTCFVTNTPVFNPTEELLAAWTQHQIQRAKEEGSILVDLKWGNSFEPARVRCRDGAFLVLVTAVNSGGGEFRAIAMKDLGDEVSHLCGQNIGS